MPAPTNKQMITDTLMYRSAVIGTGNGPLTIDDANRSVEAIGASETPVMEMDRRTWEALPTVLLMRGCVLPDNGQLPLLNNHSRYEAASVIGSYRDIRIEGDKLLGRAVFSAAAEVDGIYLRVKEGHITDLSVGRLDLSEPVVVPAGQSAVVEGRSFIGPMRVVTRWQPLEVSVTPIGADSTAKVRGAMTAAPSATIQRHEEITMADETKRAADQPSAAPQQEAGATPAPMVDRAATETEGFNRALEITSLCERHGIAGPDREALLRPEVTVDQANRTVLDLLAARSAANNPGFRPEVRVGVEDIDKYRASACAGLYLRAGLRLADDRNLSGLVARGGFTLETVADAGREFMGYSLRELARESLRRSGQPFGGDPLAMIGRAMTASDLPILLANVANKSLFEGYASADETWEIWADGSGSVSDFKTNTLVSLSEFSGLDPIVNDTGYEYGDREDAKETYALLTFGKLAAITRTTIVNDDLGGMVDTYMAMGDAAKRQVGDTAYGILTANGNMRDGKPLFHGDHGNLGTPGPVDETTIGEAEKLIGLQKDMRGERPLNIPMQFFVAPRSLRLAAEIFFASLQFSGDTKGSTRQNIYAGDKITRVYDARLDGADVKAFYLLGPKRKTVRLFFLNGNRTPYLEQKTGWSTDGVEYKVRIDVVAKAVDWKAMVKNAGA